ncbi:hypothetical protein ACFLZX_04075 [Nanoarchaeota archaeon]
MRKRLILLIFISPLLLLGCGYHSASGDCLAATSGGGFMKINLQIDAEEINGRSCEPEDEFVQHAVRRKGCKASLNLDYQGLCRIS